MARSGPVDLWILPFATDGLGNTPTTKQVLVVFQVRQRWQTRREFSVLVVACFTSCGHRLFASDVNMPPSFEIAHYPYLFVGFLTLFFTALNLLPSVSWTAHVTYGLFGGRIAGIISRVAVLCLLLVGGVGMFTLQDVQLLFSGPDLVRCSKSNRTNTSIFCFFVLCFR